MVSRRIAIGAAAVGAAAAMVAAATPALASPTYILTTGNGGTVSSAAGTINVTGAQNSTLTLNDTTPTTASLQCTGGSTVAGTAVRGTGAGPQVGTVTSAQFGTGTYSSWSTSGGTITPGSTPCTASGGAVPVAARQFPGSTWKINVTGTSTGSAHPPANPVAGQVTPGSITDIKAEVAVGKTSSCYFAVGGVDTRSPATYTNSSGPLTGGPVSGTYTNSSGTGTLAVSATGTTSLRVWNAPSAGCIGGAVKNGDVLTFGGSYSVSAVSPATNAIWINT